MTTQQSAAPDLVIFDCDGILVDTESLLNRQLVQHLAAVGLQVELKDCFELFVGRTMSDVKSYVESAIGHALPHTWIDDLRACDDAILREGVDPIGGAHEVVETLLRNDIPFCVASSGRIAKMTITLGSAGLLEHFRHVMFSADMVARGKPAPDVFLHAAATMGHAPERCLVVEDSLPGVRAAVAAGMPVLGYTGHPYSDGHALREAGATLIGDLREALDFIR